MTQRLMDTKPQSKPRTVTRQEMQVIEFNLGTDRFAIDIQNIKEIVEYTRIRPLPNSPPHIKGIIDLRGEITTIIDLALFMNQASKTSEEKKRIIILDIIEKNHKLGFLVDDVHSVLAIDQNLVDYSVHQGYDDAGHIQGIIKKRYDEGQNSQTDLIIWLNIEQILLEI